MPNPPASTPYAPLPWRRRNPARTARAVVILALVLVLHAIGVWWLLGRPSRPVTIDETPVPITVRLIKPAPVVLTPPPKPRPARHAAPRATPPTPAPVTPPVEITPPAVAAPAAAPPAATSASAATTASAPTAASAPSGPTFSPPPSGELVYDTFYNGVRNETGTIHWQLDGDRYNLFVSMPVPFVGPYTYESRGHLDAFGIAPDQYLETRGRHPADIAIFNRDLHQVIFTRTPNSVTLPDGGQDRFSLLIELAGLLRGNPAIFQPGAAREFFVVDSNSGENWPIQLIGQETIRIGDSWIPTLHLVRLPRRSGDTRRIDLWLAPALGWLPARMTQHEPGGSVIELRWHGATNLENSVAPSAIVAPTAPSPAPQAVSETATGQSGDEPIQH